MVRQSFILLFSALLILPICSGCEKESEDNRLSDELVGEWVSSYSVVLRYDMDGELFWSGGGGATPPSLLFYNNNLYFDPYMNQNVPYLVDDGDLIINGLLFGKVAISGETMSLVLDQTVEDKFSYRSRYFEHKENYYNRIRRKL